MVWIFNTRQLRTAELSQHCLHTIFACNYSTFSPGYIHEFKKKYKVSIRVSWQIVGVLLKKAGVQTSCTPHSSIALVDLCNSNGEAKHFATTSAKHDFTEPRRDTLLLDNMAKVPENLCDCISRTLANGGHCAALIINCRSMYYKQSNSTHTFQMTSSYESLHWKERIVCVET